MESSLNHRGLNACFDILAEEARELYLPREVQVRSGVPHSLDFYRKYVSANKPVVFKDAVAHWPAVTSWSNDYLRNKIGESQVTVAITPNGYADAVTGNRFVKPAECVMKFKDFLNVLEGKVKSKGVVYIQKQNSNFLEEFQELEDDIDGSISWANESFGCPPDAVNFWMGDENAVTSMHKDHYENIYCVISGYKTFILIPPTDQPYVPYETYPSGSYAECDDGTFDIVEENDTVVPWIAVDPLNPDLARYPQYSRARPIEVTVRAGEVLYLPSLWFHHVRQSHGCIAVNYWYDMAYDIRYAYYKFVEALVDQQRTDDKQETVELKCLTTAAADIS